MNQKTPFGNSSYKPNVGNVRPVRQPMIVRPPPSELCIEEFPDDDDVYFSDLNLSHDTHPPAKKPNNGTTFTFRANRPNSSAGAPNKSAQYPVDRNLKDFIMPDPATPGTANQSKTTALSKTSAMPSSFTNERSLCFMTAPIATVKQWSRYRDEVQMLVEVFGILESCVPDGKNHSVKWLKLKDQGHGLDCCFCEMDRCLPNLMLNQLYRCVGTITREGTLLCVSARPATKQEEKWKNTLMSLSAKAMYKRMARLSEV